MRSTQQPVRRVPFVRIVVATATLAALGNPSALSAQSEGALKEAFEGKKVILRIDMPANSDGADIYPDKTPRLDRGRVSQRARAAGVALKESDVSTITSVSVKGNYIEIHLGDGGATTKMLMSRLPECAELRDDGSRPAGCEQRIKQESAKLGSRFNLRYDKKLAPAQLTPESVRAALRDYVDFSDAPSAGPLDWAKSGIVKITGTIGPAMETGAGIVISVDGGAALVLTAHHVVDGAKDIQVKFYGRTYDAFKARQFERFHGDLDLALLVVEPPPGKSLPQDLPQFALRDLARVREGDPVAAIGHPQDLDWQVARNTIARLTDPDDARKVLISRSGFDRGYSGGPLLDAEGQLLGMVTRMTALHAVAVKFDAIRAVLREWNISATTRLR